AARVEEAQGGGGRPRHRLAGPAGEGLRRRGDGRARQRPARLLRPGAPARGRLGGGVGVRRRGQSGTGREPRQLALGARRGLDRPRARPDHRRRRRRAAHARRGRRPQRGRGPRRAHSRSRQAGLRRQLKVLALDYGSARTGVAVSDPTGTVARPVTTVGRAATDAGFATLLAVIEADTPELLAAGMPLTLRREVVT